MNIGKLSNDDLKRIILDKLVDVRQDILVRAGIGEDCAVVDFGETALVISTDPITGASSNIGKIALNINCNDIAASGGEPVGVMLTILAPPKTTLDELGLIMDDASREAKRLGIEILGGHTEITDAVNRVVISATAIGKVKKSSLSTSKNIVSGDVILMTKSAGLEGTGIIAYDKSKQLEDILTLEEIVKAKVMIQDISVVKDGQVASENGAKSMHDITEGGVLGAVWEMCQASQLGCVIQRESIFVEEVTLKICDYYNIDPYKLISSGSMLISSSVENSNAIIESLSTAGIKVTKIGVFTEELDKKIIDNGVCSEIHPPESDELYKII